uniref:Transmembrane BAX inhibitor motif containing 1 n=1 Tax=Scleropages formosus TaxID=113540 RepID=A0A8C9SPZ4_SCLFO
MSRSDFPPGYDESRNPLYNPQGGSYPQPPAYGFPAYGGQPQPPFGAYPGQPGMYPQSGGPQGPGHPATGMPPMLPPVLPVMPISDPEPGGNEGFTSSGSWDNQSVRHAFIRKVRKIAFKVLVTFYSVYWASYAVYFITHIVLVCCTGPRRRFPWNIILLAVFTLAMSYMTGTIASYYNTKAVLLAFGITVIVCICVTVFCFQTKVDFTSCGGFFCVLGIVVMVTGIITAIVLSFKYIFWLHMLYAAIGAIAFTLFLAYHTQLLIGNRKHSISPEEYVFGALSLYVDVIQIFVFLLQIIGGASRS